MVTEGTSNAARVDPVRAMGLARPARAPATVAAPPTIRWRRVLLLMDVSPGVVGLTASWLAPASRLLCEPGGRPGQPGFPRVPEHRRLPVAVSGDVISMAAESVLAARA